jgi:hypothetical protein
MALGVKGERKERKDGGKDCPGQPETAHMHEIHSVIAKSGSGLILLRWLVAVRKSLKIGGKLNNRELAHYSKSLPLRDSHPARRPLRNSGSVFI